MSPIHSPALFMTHNLLANLPSDGRMAVAAGCLPMLAQVAFIARARAAPS